MMNKANDISYYRGVPTLNKLAEPSAAYELQPGQTLDNRFFIVEIISRSGTATVFKSTDLKSGETVAVKVPSLDSGGNPGAYLRFLREEEIGLSLDHPCILKFFPEEEGEPRSRPYIVTEYLRGYTLAHFLESMRPLPEKDALSLASRICSALVYMHDNGITYRDLKPQNIMICYDGSLRIMEFGSAKSGDKRLHTFAGLSPADGTPDYKAPELIKGKQGDERADIYSLGALLYEMAVGETPFDGENLFEVVNTRITCDPVAPGKRNPNVSPQVEEIILRAMERNPDKRYPKAAAMKTDLDNPLATVQLTGRCDRLKSPSSLSAGGNVFRRSVLAAAAVLLVIGLVLWLIIKRGSL